MLDSEGYFGRVPDYFGGGYWGDGYWGDGVARSTLFEEGLAFMENVDIGEYCFEAGCVEPGCDNVNVPLRRILDNLE